MRLKLATFLSVFCVAELLAYRLWMKYKTCYRKFNNGRKIFGLIKKCSFVYLNKKIGNVSFFKIWMSYDETRFSLDWFRYLSSYNKLPAYDVKFIKSLVACSLYCTLNKMLIWGTGLCSLPSRPTIQHAWYALPQI